GPEQASEALRRALAMGGDEAYLVTDRGLAGADLWATARVLAAALDKLAPDVALMGMSSDDAKGSLVPGAVAAIRGLPLLSYGSELRLEDSVARIRRLNATGYDIIEAPLPVIASVTDQVGEPRYASLKGIMAAKRKPLETWSLADLGISAAELRGAALTRVIGVRPRHRPFAMGDWRCWRRRRRTDGTSRRPWSGFLAFLPSARCARSGSRTAG